MKEALKTAMMTSISEVLETMFFMTFDLKENAATDELPHSSEVPLFISKIGFHGNFSGYFLLMIPENILRTMTVTFMGLDEGEITETHLNGTVLEAINMIAGNTFSNLDNQAIFDLGIPELIDKTTAAQSCSDKTQEEFFFLIENYDGRIELKVCFNTN